MQFTDALEVVLLREGMGGSSIRYGIRQAMYDDYKDSQEEELRPVVLMSDTEMRAIYMTYFWAPAKCNTIAAAGKWNLALLALDCAKSASPEISRHFVQAALNCVPDGIFNEPTLDALASKAEAPVLNRFLRLRALALRARCGDGAALAGLSRTMPERMLERVNPNHSLSLGRDLARIRACCRAIGAPVDEVLFGKGSHLVPLGA